MTATSGIAGGLDAPGGSCALTASGSCSSQASEKPIDIEPGAAQHARPTRLSDATGPLQAFHPARRKKSNTIDSPKVCCSPGSGASRMRGGRWRRSQHRGWNVAPSPRSAFCSRKQADRHVGEVAIVVGPHLPELPCRGGEQDPDTASPPATPLLVQRFHEADGLRLLLRHDQAHQLRHVRTRHRGGGRGQRGRGGRRDRAAQGADQPGDHLLLDGAGDDRHQPVVLRDVQVGRAAGRVRRAALPSLLDCDVLLHRLHRISLSRALIARASLSTVIYVRIA